MIHIDGYDKLKPYGFSIHGAIDGFSRRILWLKVMPSNKNPRVIGNLFVKFLQEIGRVPRMVRCDAGTENVLVRDIQITLRSFHNDTYRFGGSDCWFDMPCDVSVLEDISQDYMEEIPDRGCMEKFLRVIEISTGVNRNQCPSATSPAEAKEMCLD
ncbi:unnamed protein product [Mytilus coruscus]|uniref:Integrase core domain-containing protein n=1 Tax=Mytilus coruscus TaxID=42192 RepID=A0A6J8AJW1_MYTCO|nr:unnamed protein product [Mytilus coruscus]